MAVSIIEFKKALDRLEEVMALEASDIIKDSAIQRFEFTVELAWKVSKKFMALSITAPKQVIREMASNGLVSDINIWFDAINYRNLASHTYNQSLADEVYSFISLFLPHAKELHHYLDNN